MHDETALPAYSPVYPSMNGILALLRTPSTTAGAVAPSAHCCPAREADDRVARNPPAPTAVPYYTIGGWVSLHHYSLHHYSTFTKLLGLPSPNRAYDEVSIDLNPFFVSEVRRRTPV